MTGTPPVDPTPGHPAATATSDDAFVAALLATLPRTAMPADVVARIDAALAALAHAPGAPVTPLVPPAVDAASPAAAADPGAIASVTPLAPRTGPALPAPRRGRTALAALAGVAAVVVAASLATTAGLQGASAPTAADAAGPVAVPTTPQGQLSAGFDGPLRVLMSGTAYESERLLSQVSSTLSRAGGALLGMRTAGPAERSGSPAESSSRLAGCIHMLTGGAGDPAVVDLASYEGRPATVLVIRDTRAAAGTVWVVGRDCDDDTASLITVRRISWPASSEEPGAGTGSGTGTAGAGTAGAGTPATGTPTSTTSPDASDATTPAGTAATTGTTVPGTAASGPDQPTSQSAPGQSAGATGATSPNPVAGTGPGR